MYYGECKAAIAIDGELLAGSLPYKQLKMVVGWLALHEEEAYAGEYKECIEVIDAKILDDYMMPLTFSTGDSRFFNAKKLLKYPAFKPLEDEATFRKMKIEYGVITWADVEIDIAPETLYKESFAYEPMVLI